MPKSRSAKAADVLLSSACFRLILKRSPIEGYGVYAGETIPARKFIIEYTGEKISLREATKRFRRLMRKRAPKHDYLFRIGRKIVDGAVGGSGAEYINHSCAPNLLVRPVFGRICLFSRRRIRKGEELAYDYAFPPEATCFPCRCGSPRCRGTINRVVKK